MIAEFLGSPAGIAMKLTLALAFADAASGIWRAQRDDVLALDAIGACIRKHLLGRVLPIAILLIAGWLSADVTINMAATAALGVYGTETGASLYAAWRVPGSARIPID